MAINIRHLIVSNISNNIKNLNQQHRLHIKMMKFIIMHLQVINSVLTKHIVLGNKNHFGPVKHHLIEYNKLLEDIHVFPYSKQDLKKGLYKSKRKINKHK